MKSSIRFIASLAMFTGIHAAAVAEPGPNATPHQYPVIYSSYTSFSSPPPTPLTSVHWPTPTPPPAGNELVAEDNGGGFSLFIYNSAGYPLSLEYTLGSTKKDGTLSAFPAPTSGGQPGTLPQASATGFAAPPGWAGNIVFGIAGAAVDYRGSRIEGSVTTADDPITDIDVSYVEGYSAPIICYGENSEWLSGCFTNLFAENQCEDWSPNGDVCINTALNDDCGPAPKFFAPCQGFAYTFPNDNNANSDNALSSKNFYLCCVDSIDGTAQNCPSANSARSGLGPGQDPATAACKGKPATRKRDESSEEAGKRGFADTAPVDPATGTHWFYNSTFYTNYTQFRKDNGLPPAKIPANAFIQKS